MKLIERYISGQTVEVYQDIYLLGERAFEEEYRIDVNNVLNETFQRVRYNIETIYNELLSIGYQFRTKFEYRSQEPITNPLRNCEELLKKLDKIVGPFGYIPLSLKYFYRIVGSCNFTWDYETNEKLLWKYADPIEILGLDDLIDMMIDMDWKHTMREIIKEEGKGSPAYIEFSADYYHKDNVSGGQAYAIEVTKMPTIDSRVLFNDKDFFFIDYLRKYFENCGFLKITYPEYNNDYLLFFNKVIPKLKKI